MSQVGTRRSSRRVRSESNLVEPAQPTTGRKRKCQDNDSELPSILSAAGQLVYREPLKNGMKVVDLAPRDKVDYTGIQSDLDHHGFCVVADVLSSEDRTRFQDLFWKAMRDRKPALTKDMQTWTKDNVEWKGTFGVGHFKHYGMAQEEHCWLIRRNKAIKSIFEKAVYDGEKELCVSMDALGVLLRVSKSLAFLSRDSHLPSLLLQRGSSVSLTMAKQAQCSSTSTWCLRSMVTTLTLCR
jgi:hypothetical protein